MDELKRALEWHKQAVPNPTDRNKCIALGVHFEEIAEMFEALCSASKSEKLSHITDEIHSLANAFKRCSSESMKITTGVALIPLADSIFDQNVTSCGISNAFRFDHIGGLGEVNDSNYSKFEGGKPVFNEQGKISKGVDYKPPQLERFIK